MNRFINRLKLIFLVIFAIGCTAAWTYQLMYARPEAICEGHGDWWDWHTRICAHPTPLYVFTRRQPHMLGPGEKTPSAARPASPSPAPAAKP